MELIEVFAACYNRKADARAPQVEFASPLGSRVQRALISLTGDLAGEGQNQSNGKGRYAAGDGAQANDGGHFEANCQA